MQPAGSQGHDKPFASPLGSVPPMAKRTSPTSAGLPTQPERRLALRRDWQYLSSRIFDLAWSPTTPTHLVTAGEDAAMLWSSQVGSPPTCRLKLQLTPTSSASAPSWITAGKRPASSEDSPQGPACVRCTWHPDGAHVLTGSDDGCVAVWSAHDGAKLAQLSVASVTDEADSEVYGLQVLSRESLLAVACSDTVQQWDLLSGRQTAHTKLRAHESGVAFGGSHRNPNATAYVFSLASRGRVLVAALSDGTCRLLDAQTCKELATLDAHVQRGTPAFACALSPTSTLLATTGGDGCVLLWDMRMLGSGPLSERSGHTQAVHGVCFASAGALGAPVDAGELLVTGGSDCTLRIHETALGVAAASSGSASSGSASGGAASGGDGAASSGAGCIAAMRMSGPVWCASFTPGSAAGGERLGAGGGSGSNADDNALFIFSSASRQGSPGQGSPDQGSPEASREEEPAVERKGAAEDGASQPRSEDAAAEPLPDLA